MKQTLLLPVLFLSLLVAHPARAVTRSFTNSAGGDWSVAANWSPNGVPTGIDVANITNSGTYTVTIASSSVAVSTYNLGGASGTQTLALQSGNSVTAAGTVRANGILDMSSGSLLGSLVILSGGQLQLNTAANKFLDTLNLINQGTVTWNAGQLLNGGQPATVVSNGGQWLMTGDYSFNAYSAQTNSPVWINTGLVRKSAGAGASTINNFNVDNQPSGVIQADTGILRLPAGTMNSAGILRVNGGQLEANGTLTMAGGTLEGTGSVGANLLVGGNIAPGTNGPGLLTFPSSLNLRSGSTLTLAGTNTLPGAYDQLSVVGAVALSNATLQVTSLPTVPVGTTFIIITNDGVDAVQGTFSGLPENALVPVGAQPFRIHYAGGSGNDVTLVRDTGSITLGPLLSSGNYSGGTFQLLGSGSNGVIYRMQATTNFVQWTNIGFATGGVSGNFLFNDTNAFRYQYRFYRTTN